MAGADTEYTPAAQESELWTQVGGAEFGEREVPAGSPTPTTVDFYTTDFVLENQGFAGGAKCADPAIPFEQLDECERVPAIYRYSQAPGEDPRWEEVALPGSDRPGYVGGIAWIGPGRALAVGGTGCYPRREEPCPDGSTEPGADPAGTARAWLYAGGAWNEIEDLPETESGEAMAGLSAVDCSPREADGEFCVTGGLRQLWHWREGEFAESFTPGSATTRLDGAAGFRFRIRGVRFDPRQVVEAGRPEVAAITSGCCTAEPTNRTPKIVVFDGDKWYVRLAAYDLNEQSEGPSAATYNDIVEAERSVHPPQSLADSYYGQPLISSATGSQWPSVSFLLSAGGPRQPVEAASRVVSAPLASPFESQAIGGVVDSGLQASNAGRDGAGSADTTGFLLAEVTNPRVSSARLVAGDGDFFGQSNRDLSNGQGWNRVTDDPRVGPDGIIDWAVGELRSTGQGIAYTTVDGLVAEGLALDCPGDPQITQVQPLDCTPGDPGEVAAETSSQRLIELPSYAVNWISFVPESSVAWAAGDKGGLLRLGGAAAGAGGGAADEPVPPKLGAARPAPLADDAAYDGFRPGTTAEPGQLPTLSELPAEDREEPGFVPAGTPDPNLRDSGRPQEEIGEIVSSRDGSEAWAIGPGMTGSGDPAPGSRALHHWDGSRWTRCDPVEKPHRDPADPACASLADAFRQRVGSDESQGIRIYTAARIPLERDPDPTNDDEFEIVAVGGEYDPPGPAKAGYLTIRYRDGRWSVDEEATADVALDANMHFSDIAFTAPDDGWLIGGPNQISNHLLHFDGERWRSCTAENAAAECGDPDGVLPVGVPSPSGFVVAGERIYLFANRSVSAPGTNNADRFFPVILHKEPGGDWTAEGGGYDPGFGAGHEPHPDNGWVGGISVIRLPDGSYTGWATGRFGTDDVKRRLDDNDQTASAGSESRLLRLDGGSWQHWPAGDAATDYPLTPSNTLNTSDHRHSSPPISFVGPDGEERSFILPRRDIRPIHPLLSFDADDGEWEVLRTPFMSRTKAIVGQTQGVVNAAAPDNVGGMFLAVRQASPIARDTVYYRWTNRSPRATFEDVPHPVREPVIASAAGPDGSFWVATESRSVYRYDRVTGWSQQEVPGWDPGRVATRPARAAAIAIGPSGDGLLVGEGGRIAELTSHGVRLDRAAGTSCLLGSAPPCGTGRDLTTAAVAGDGSALVGGEGRALLWRPAGEAFRAIEPPNAPPDATFTAIAMPSPTNAWLTTSGGQIWGGRVSGGAWSWELENLAPDGRLLSQDPGALARSLNAIEVDAAGAGLAVGQRGLVLDRDPASGEWRRIDIDSNHDLTSVALDPGPGTADAIGGELGLILTRRGHGFAVARQDEYYSPLENGVDSEHSGRIVGLELVPGTAAGELEAWALLQVPFYTAHERTRPTAVLHYASDPGNPLLDATSRVEPVADVESDPGDLSFAALGRSECHLNHERETCPEPHVTTLFNEAAAGQAIDEIAAGAGPGADPSFTLFTGDAVSAPGRDRGAEGGQLPLLSATSANTALDTDVMHRRWVETFAEPALEEGVPLLGAVGTQDLSGAKVCDGIRCAGTEQAGGAGTTEGWRRATAAMPAPWGGGDAPVRDGVVFEPVGARETDGAATYYAADVVRNGEALARLVVTDTSMRSLAASDPTQSAGQPQAEWLEEVLCVEGSPAEAEGRDCSRAPGQESIVVTNTPTYTYSDQISPSALQADSAAFEAIMLRHDVSVVVAGRLGWNGLYYALAPGLHCPVPGGEYPTGPPSSGAGAGCAQETSDLVGQTSLATGEATSGEAGGTGEIPFVVASTGGGRFGPDGEVEGEASDGFWHGYSVVHLDPETGEVEVEQRPVLDWLSLHADRRTVAPRARLTLEGEGREPVGIDTPIRYDAIDSHAITHRYDLLLADPEQPWMPCAESDPGCLKLQANLGAAAGEGEPSAAEAAEHGCAPYLCLPAKVGTVNRTTGELRAGDGRYPQTFGLAMLSVGAKSATYPLVFERSPSFVVKSALRTLGAPVPHKGAGATAPPPPPTPDVPKVPEIKLPAVPVPPAIPLLAAASPPEPQAPVPPAPPPPAQQPAPLDLSVAPTGVSLTPPTALIQPPTPPVNPAPPGGARREARQRQAAAQKSGADAEEGAQDGAGDLAENPQSPTGAEMTRRDAPFARRPRSRPEPSFSAYRPAADSSPLGPGALYASGLTLLAFALAAGWSRGRPTPRRREPELPAPAWGRAPSHRR